MRAQNLMRGGVGWAGWKKREERSTECGLASAPGFPDEPAGRPRHLLPSGVHTATGYMLTIAYSVILALVELEIRVLGHRQFSGW